MVDFVRSRSIKYLNKDFQSFKRDLIKYSQAHLSGVFQDHNESSSGMALLEMNAYVGDVLSFYMDKQFSEIRQDTTRQIENAAEFAKSIGYRPAGKRAARGVQYFFVEVPATTVNNEVVPDDLYSPILRRGARVTGPDGIPFETLEDVIFSASAPTFGTDEERIVTGSRIDEGTGLPTHFALRKQSPTIAGETKLEDFTIDEFQQFREIELPDEDVIEVISVFDSSGEEWFEVSYLAEDTVFDFDMNDGEDSDVVPFVLKLRPVPRRFITDRDALTNKTKLIFGSGDGIEFDDELVPNLADLALPLAGRRTFSSFALDPQNFLKTRSLGLSPFNTTLTVTYRTGGGINTNVEPRTIKDVAQAELNFTTTGLDALRRSDVIGSLETINLERTEGGAEEESISEIKANSAAFFAAQARVVTREDYIARIMSLPERFGKPDKVFPRSDNINESAINIHVLSRDPDGKLVQASTTLTENIKTYLKKFRMLTDGVNLLQTDIINLKIEFGVVVSPKFNRTEVVTKCLDIVREYVDTDRMQIGSPLVISDLQAEIQDVLGVISVYKLQFKNVVGRQVGGLEYSGNSFDVQANTANNILYCPQNAIFEIKFPSKDITGESK